MILIFLCMAALFSTRGSSYMYQEIFTLTPEPNKPIFLIPFHDEIILRIEAGKIFSSYNLGDSPLTPKPFCREDWPVILSNPVKILSYYPFIVVILKDKAYCLSHDFEKKICKFDQEFSGKYNGNIDRNYPDDEGTTRGYTYNSFKKYSVFEYSGTFSDSEPNFYNGYSKINDLSYISFIDNGKTKTQILDVNGGVKTEIPTGDISDSTTFTTSSCIKNVLYCRNNGKITSYDSTGKPTNELDLDTNPCKLVTFNPATTIIGGATDSKVKFWDLSNQLIFEDSSFTNIQHIGSFKFQTSNFEGFTVSSATKSVILVKYICHQSCATCSGPAINQCQTCTNGLQPLNGACCDEGTFFDGSGCQSCPRKCAACESLSKCTKCKNRRDL
jgi:hypothetical protein